MKLESIKKFKKGSSNGINNRNKKDKQQRIGADGVANEDEKESIEIDKLRERVVDECPESGTQLHGVEVRFDAMPISRKTLSGLSTEKLVVATDIQLAAIPHALAGRDILGAAKTGSGKTLAFIIPIIERLYTERWSSDDGLAAIIITPTRELALQIFEVLRTVGKRHQLSAGIVTGGRKEYEGEQERIISMNILVATPGRLLQHFEETPGFDASQLQLLVLDEADRILDLGFKSQLDRILDYLPPRQTLLFSATQTKSVKDLARLSLNNPEYLAVHAEDDQVTPKQLVQNYVIVQLHNKLDVLFSFIKMHLKSKMIVFFSTCSQVRFVYECMRGMQPGIPLLNLHGKIKQERRTLIYMEFIRKKAACMFATDIAARGLDFPDVDWVIQVDAPEDNAMYIHRVGRTARYNAGGRALLMVLPHEEDTFIPLLQQQNVPIKKLTVNPKITTSVASQAAALLVAQPECRALAKKAFVGYLRSLQLIPNNSQLDVKSLPLDDFATSLGLAFTPIVPIVPKGNVGREQVRTSKNINRTLDKLKKQVKEAKEAKRRLKDTGTDADSDADSDADALKSKRKGKKKVTKPVAVAVEAVDDDSGDELFSVKKDSSIRISDDDDDAPVAGSSSNKKKKVKIRVDTASTTSKKTLFDDAGDEVVGGRFTELVHKSDKDRSIGSSSSSDMKDRVDDYTRRVKARVDEARGEDDARERVRIKEKHKAMKLKGKDSDAASSGVQLKSYIQEDDSQEYSDNDDDDDDDGDVHMHEQMAMKLLQRKK